MELVEAEKKSSETTALRLVSDITESQTLSKSERQFVNFIFFRIGSDWRKLGAEAKAESRREFERVFAVYSAEMLMFSYSLVGFDSKADLMFWRIGEQLDQIQEMTVRLFRTTIGSYLETTDNYLSITKKRKFVPAIENVTVEDRFSVVAGDKKYLFVYPCAKNRDWYEKTGEERERLNEENFMVGKKFSSIKIHMTHAFGFSEQEFMVLFETDEPKDFLALAEELSHTQASKSTLRGTPVYTCRQRTLAECLDAFG